jgi:hypothetical protein
MGEKKQNWAGSDCKKSDIYKDSLRPSLIVVI